MSPVNSLWFKWKSLRLPWRRSFLVDSLNSNRLRRIVKYNRKVHYADVKISPQWHQWLRYVRQDPPSLEEQQQDVVRQMQIKKLAQIADERWASKPSYLDRPQTQQPGPATRTSDATLHPEKGAAPDRQPGVMNAIQSQAEAQEQEKKPDTKPWARKMGGPSENWQPEAWTPTAAKR
ncbi:hypothetical protein T310_6107 [Rasamsonia emersonii CBS 393.64]|uniref:Uncharacterized protein n=1 Tax=Rasamsonia emersonii (strain ATCC 16479 / CBS 393.64 / IMI 116815) TaxID=1408163 RepID=A0A0F4YQK5_RASE3|nr:hypothetical protein T310_6107 [Rasamsonia emersonii CBS 393.64]KKA19908.1 hypothetical protein T310_6107 [Rasamsonia emersonii CBS 393.64]